MRRDENGLTPKQARFVAEYLKDLNASQACIRAGYSTTAPNVRGSQLLALRNIAAAVATGKAKQLARNELSADRVLEELRRLGFSDIGEVVDENDNLLKLRQIPIEARSAVSSVEVVRQNVAAGDGHTDFVHKIRLWDKPRALETLAKHFALLTEVVKHTADAELLAVLQSARRQVE